ncbi:transposase [Flavobacterium salmonis]|uniref:Transposase n=1 Tax=Flavobacterium salmonis TaxID=2654844 RepID=A0A6V6YSH3_9FLAO|nr:transposase [Flavobacterium salmonis]
MKQLGLYSKLSKKFKVTTNSKHNHFVVPNILKREFTVKEPSKAWISDITYIQTKEGFFVSHNYFGFVRQKIIG